MKLVDLRGSLPKHKTLRYSKRTVKPSIIAIHHSLTKSGTPQAFANYHVNTNGWPGIAYHYVVAKDGTVYICNDTSLRTYHVGDSNNKAIGICLVGDFRSEKPTKEQYQATIELVRDLLNVLPGAEIKGHSELPGYTWKACPVINMNQFRADVIVKKEVATMSQEVSEWAKEAQQWAKEKGVSDGTRPKDPVTREEVWTMLYNFHKTLNKNEK